MKADERRAWAADLRAAAERLILPPIASGANIHRVAQVRQHLLLVADFLDGDYDDGAARKIMAEAVTLVGRLIETLGAYIVDDAGGAEREKIRAAWEALRAVMGGIIGPAR